MGSNLDPKILQKYSEELKKSAEKKSLVYNFIENKIDKYGLNWLAILELLSTHDISYEDSRMDDKSVLEYFIEIIEAKIEFEHSTKFCFGVIVDAEKTATLMEDTRKKEQNEKKLKLSSIEGIKKMIKQFNDIDFTFENFIAFFKSKKQTFEVVYNNTDK